MWFLSTFIIIFVIYILCSALIARMRIEFIAGAKEFLTFYMSKRKELIDELEKKVEEHNKLVRRIDPNAN